MKQLDFFEEDHTFLDDKRSFIVFAKYKTAIAVNNETHNACATFMVQHDLWHKSIGDLKAELHYKDDLLRLGFKVLVPQHNAYTPQNYNHLGKKRISVKSTPDTKEYVDL